jgi:hypothetical protein
MAVSDRFFRMFPLQTTSHSVSAEITMLEENITWCLTGVYGPQADQEKIAFLQEISDLRQHMRAAWLIIGDFNLIYRAEDKNNDRVNIRMLNRFKNTIDNLQLAPLELKGRRFTWCNDQQNPTMTKIDHFLASNVWLEIFPRPDLQALASLGSDHCPLFLQGDTEYDFYRGFRFEAHWINMPGFIQTVQTAWEQPVDSQDPMLRMHVKLLRTARALKIWRRTQFSDWKLRDAILHLILLELEKAQERRTLSTEELEFKKYLKVKSLGLAAIQKARARQHSRLTWIRKGDSNTRFFQLHANARRKKSYISTIQSEEGLAVTQQDKTKIALEFFSKAVGSRMQRQRAINWEQLGYSPYNLEDLDTH